MTSVALLYFAEQPLLSLAESTDILLNPPFGGFGGTGR